MSANRENENIVALNYRDSNLVIEANELVRSRKDELTILEAKLIRLAISQILDRDKDFKTYTCNIVDLAKYLGISKENIYRDIQELGKTIMKRTIYIEDKEPTKSGKKNYKLFHWVDSIEYKDGIITFQLSESLKPYLLGLKELFTRYSYKSIIKLPTNNSIMLYELLASWQNATVRNTVKPYSRNIELKDNEIAFTVEYLRDYFDCKEKYPNTGDFIKRIIDSSVLAIIKNTSMKISYRQVKSGRIIKYIVFAFDDYFPEDKTFTDKIREIEEKYGI